MTQLSSPVLYQERALPSLGFYAATLFIPVATFLIALPFSEEAGLLVAMVSIVGILAISWLTSPLIKLSPEQLSIGKIQIETVHLGKAKEILGADAFQERGHRLDSRAFSRFQIGVRQLVKIEITDKDDPTPYWLISTRNPEVLAALINKL